MREIRPLVGLGGGYMVGQSSSGRSFFAVDKPGHIIPPQTPKIATITIHIMGKSRTTQFV